jgi:hypothetical protein
MAAKRRAAFHQIDLDAEARQGSGGGQAADSGPDHENAVSPHSVPLHHQARRLIPCVI